MSSSWFPFARVRTAARARLVCFPYAGGGATVFREWQSQLAAPIEVLAVQLPGRENRFREAPLESAAELVEALLPQLAGRLDLPLALFGHSLGAQLAFELARRLADERPEARVLRVFLSACGAPHVPKPELLHLLPDAALEGALARMGGTPAAILGDRTLLGLFAPALRADLRMSETYAPPAGTRLALPITILGGESDGEVALDRLQAWAELTRGPSELRLLPGGHFYLRESRAQLLDLIGLRVLADLDDELDAGSGASARR